MDNEKLKKVALIIFSVLVVLVVIEVGIKSGYHYVEKRVDFAKQEEINNKYESSPQYKEEKFLEDSIKDFMELINSKNTDELYKHLNEDYLDYKFNNSKEVFSKYVNENLKTEDATFELQDYDKINGRFRCRILSHESGDYSSFRVLITPSGDSYNIILDDMLSIKKIEDIYSEKNNLKATILYNVSLSGACTYLVEYENIGKDRVEYTYDEVKLINTNGYEYLCDIKGSNISIEPDTKLRVEYIFSGSGIHVYDKTKLEISMSNGQKKELFRIFL